MLIPGYTYSEQWDFLRDTHVINNSKEPLEVIVYSKLHYTQTLFQ